jgi:hypothetical protein
MTKHPFTGINIKTYLSGIDASFEDTNIADSYIIAGNDIKELISAALYDKLCGTLPTTPTETKDVYEEARERLRYAMAPLTIYHHFIWLQIRISNNSMTTYKSQNETTLYNYQSIEAKDNLLLRHGVFVKELIDYLEEKKTIITEWAQSDQKKELDGLVIKSYRDFDKVFNTNGDAAFFIRSRVVQQEAMDEVGAFVDLDTILTAETPDKILIRKLQKAIAYLTMARVVNEWNDAQLPAVIRQSIAMENTGKTKPDAIIQKLSNKYRNIAESVLREISLEKAVTKTETDYPNDAISINRPEVSETDKFYSSL